MQMIQQGVVVIMVALLIPIALMLGYVAITDRTFLRDPAAECWRSCRTTTRKLLVRKPQGASS